MRVEYKTWSPAIHNLKFTDDVNKDKDSIRFGYCDSTGKLIVRPLNLSESELTELRKEAAKDPEIKKMLKGFCEQSGALSSRANRCASIETKVTKL
jgi:hypothetical protein